MGIPETSGVSENDCFDQAFVEVPERFRHFLEQKKKQLKIGGALFPYLPDSQSDWEMHCLTRTRSSV